MIKYNRSANARLAKLQEDFGRSFLKAVDDIPTSTSKIVQSHDSNSVSPERERNCICHRKPKTLVCTNCKMFTYGRITQRCPEHLNVTFLMDFFCCPNCLGPKHQMRGVDVDHSSYQDINANTSVRSTHINMAYESAAASAYKRF